MTDNPALNSFMEWLESEELSRQQMVRTYRDYYEGDPPTVLTDRMRSYLSLERKKEFGANVCAVIVDTVVERLGVTGFTVSQSEVTEQPEDTDNTDGQTDEDRLAQLLDSWWQQNRMDATQDWVHQAALRDAESFVIVEYDEDNKRPKFSHDYAYDGSSGVKVTMKPGTYREIAFASKRWTEGKNTSRLNLYFDNRIEKWVSSDTGEHKEAFWQPYTNDEDDTLQLVELEDSNGKPYTASVAWWTNNGNETGDPLGVPVIPFRNRDDGTGRGLSELDNAIPMQDAINKIFIDLLVACDYTAFQMYWAIGDLPDDLKVYPGAFINVTSEAGDTGKAGVGVLPAGDVSGLIASLQSSIALLSGITSTPQSRFTPAAVRPAEGTQRQEESALVAKVEGLHKVWGNAWEDVLRMGMKVASAFGNVAIPDTSTLVFDTQWKDAKVRSEKEQAEELAIKVDKLQVPVKQAWSEIGYTAEQIRGFEEEKDKQRNADIDKQLVINQGKQADTLAMMGQAAAAQRAGGNGQPGQAAIPPGPVKAMFK